MQQVWKEEGKLPLPHHRSTMVWFDLGSLSYLESSEKARMIPN